MQLPTLTELIEMGFVSTALDHLDTFEVEYVSKPLPPHLPSNPTANQAKVFSEEMEKFENHTWPEYVAAKIIRDKLSGNINFLKEELIKQESGLNALPISDKQKSKVYSKAWDAGHSSGYYEVYIELIELVELFID